MGAPSACTSSWRPRLLGDVPNKLFNLLAQRITFTQADPSDYTMIVGRGWTRFNDVPGRGPGGRDARRPAGAARVPDRRADHVRGGRSLPRSGAAHGAGLGGAGEEDAGPQGEAAQGGGTARPDARCGRAPAAARRGAAQLAAPLGINDLDRETTLIEFGAKGPNWIVVGPPVSGKTTTLRSLVLSLAHCYPPDRVAMILVDPSDAARRFFNFGAGGDNSLDRLPHVLATVTNAEELDAVVRRLSAEYDDEVIKESARQAGVQAGGQHEALDLRDHRPLRRLRAC